MEAKEVPTHKSYDIARQLSAVAMLGGAILLIDHLAAQIKHGSGSSGWLTLGAVSFGAGLLFFVLFGIGIRLHRIECLLKEKDSKGESGSDLPGR